MAEYIDRDEVIAWIWKQKRLSKGYTVMVIQDLPAADVEPVRHGRWEEADWVEPDHKGFELIRTPKAAWRCSRCCHCFKKELLWKDDYCPNCGARMDGAE